MIKGIGTDIVDIARMSEVVKRQGDKFAQRILTMDELSRYQKSPDKARFLAKRFAAKEAVAKAFGTGFSQGLSLKHIAIVNNTAGKPEVLLSGKAIELKQQSEITNIQLSIADEKVQAIAFVIMESC